VTEPKTAVYDAYGRLAALSSDPNIVSGRYGFQAGSEQAIAADVLAKLRPGPDSSLLEIGCGSGLLLHRLAPHVAEAVGLDHPACLARARLLVPENVTLVEGSWPDTTLDRTFDRILTYSVIHCLIDESSVVNFIDAAVGSLAPGGWCLIGDVPNPDAAARFASTATGRQVTAEHRRRVAESRSEDDQIRDSVLVNAMGDGSFLGDLFVSSTITRLRAAGLESYVLPQPRSLPFGFTREDLLIHRRST
jgi:SAM-dependent methyltransferase